MSKDNPDFGTVGNFAGDVVTIALRGTNKKDAAFELAAILDAAIDRRAASTVLEVSELDCLGMTGMLAFSNADKRAATLGVAMTLRSPSALVNRLLSIIESAGEASRTGPPRTLLRLAALGPLSGSTTAPTGRGDGALGQTARART